MLIANTYSSDFIRRFVGDSLAESIKSASDLAKSGNYSDAIEAYLSIIDTDSANANAWYCLGVLYAQDNSLENAIEAFEKSDKTALLSLSFLKIKPSSNNIDTATNEF